MSHLVSEKPESITLLTDKALTLQTPSITFKHLTKSFNLRGP